MFGPPPYTPPTRIRAPAPSVHRDSEFPRIVNYVSSFSWNNAFVDLEYTAYRFPATEYNPGSFAAAKFRWERTVALAFGGRSAVCPGAGSEHDSALAAMRISHFIARNGTLVNFQNFKPQNLVCNVCFPSEVDIDALNRDPYHDAHTRLKLERFPGLTYTIPRKRTGLNIYTTGHIVVTGTKTFAESCASYAFVRNNALTKYAKHNVVSKSTSSSDFKFLKLRQRRSEIRARLHTVAGRLSRQRLNVAEPAQPVRAYISDSPLVADNAATALLQRISRFFCGHTMACPFVTIGFDDAHAVWAMWAESLQHADADTRAASVREHVASGCLHRVPDDPDTYIAVFLDQLRAAARDCKFTGTLPSTQPKFGDAALLDADYEARLAGLRGHRTASPGHVAMMRAALSEPPPRFERGDGIAQRL